MKQPVVDALADTLVEEEAKTQDDTLGDMETETLVEALADTPARDGGQNTWRHSGRYEG